MADDVQVGSFWGGVLLRPVSEAGLGPFGEKVCEDCRERGRRGRVIDLGSLGHGLCVGVGPRRCLSEESVGEWRRGERAVV
ncbi:hypothetical protein KKC08_04740 [Patescibacteria group bacterium]|nr:hypothetical protein [Patescibacteria group bacterium]MCG2701960.1 hypothetical protein [Candidatus Parcubacteria bacterium]MBU4265038.1 hypothetical protein [Patescibacteria group bacterium]MBU4390191.1 hypothetical protein [Patescibacteria group bacterium]MBU4397445.1 hypothetical protein [Patescibacteria group bacterium]